MGDRNEVLHRSEYTLDMPSDDLELVQVQMVLRHGNRTPLHDPYACLPVDMNRCSRQPLVAESDRGSRAVLRPFRSAEDLEAIHSNMCMRGQLTDMGWELLSSFGKRLREQLVGEGKLLPDEYSKGVVYVRCTDLPRTQNSALAILEGLYPSNRVPFDIFYKSSGHRFESMYPLSSCYRYSFLLNVWQQSMRDELEEEPRRRPGLARFWKEASRRNDDHTVSIYDHLAYRMGHDIPLPKGLTDADFQSVAKAAAKYFWGGFVHDHELTRLAIGRFVGELGDNCRLALGLTWAHSDPIPPWGKGDVPKLVIYSGHDSTLSPLLAAFGLQSDTHWPPLASTMIIETYKTKTAAKKGEPDAFLRFKYNDQVVTPLGMESKNGLVVWRDFDQAIKKFVPLDFWAECKKQDKGKGISVTMS